MGCGISKGQKNAIAPLPPMGIGMPSTDASSPAPKSDKDEEINPFASSASLVSAPIIAEQEEPAPAAETRPTPTLHPSALQLQSPQMTAASAAMADDSSASASKSARRRSRKASTITVPSSPSQSQTGLLGASNPTSPLMGSSSQSNEVQSPGRSIIDRNGLGARNLASLPPLKTPSSAKSLPPVKSRTRAADGTSNDNSPTRTPREKGEKKHKRRKSESLTADDNAPLSRSMTMSPLSHRQSLNPLAALPPPITRKQTGLSLKALTEGGSAKDNSVASSSEAPPPELVASLQSFPCAYSSPALVERYPDFVYEHYLALINAPLDAMVMPKKALAALAKDCVQEFIRAYQLQAEPPAEGTKSKSKSEAMRSMGSMLGVEGKDGKRPDRESLETAVHNRLRVELRPDANGNIGKAAFIANYLACHTRMFGKSAPTVSPEMACSIM